MILPILASLVAIAIWEHRKQPRLIIEIPARMQGKEPSVQQLESTSRAFYHLKVKNVGKSPAYSCGIRIRFLHADTQEELFTVNGKWDRGPQPLIYSPVATRVLQDGTIESQIMETRQDFLIPFAEVLDIHPGLEPEGFGILVKYQGEAECYAFSSWSYILGTGHKVDAWRLNAGKYIVELKLVYSGKGSLDKRFVVVNQGTALDSIEIKQVNG